MKNRGPFKVKSSKKVYKNPWIEVKEDKVIRPDGTDGIFGIIDYGKGVTIVALNHKKELFLVKEFFYALNRFGIHLPSGGVDTGETSLQAAKRELREETGVVAKTWKSLGYVDPLTQILSCPHELFLATDIQELEKEEEEIENIKMPFSEAYQMVLDSKITHAPSCIAILKAKFYIDNQKMNKQQAFSKIAKEIETCDVCKSGKHGKAVPGEGNPDAEIVFIGEAPGKQEAATGRPFIGRSGQLLRRLIREIGLDDEKDVYITSPVKYLPDRGTPTSQDIAHGRIHLMKQFAVIQPKIVVLLGRVAAEGVLEKKVKVASEHGQVIAEKEGIKYFLTLHPAAALRFPHKYKPLIERDFRKIKGIIKD